jgi:hypothetical protein
MTIKFIGATMPIYKGSNGLGQVIELKKGETAEVSEQVGKILLQKYKLNFQAIVEQKDAEEPAKNDKKQRKIATFRAK